MTDAVTKRVVHALTDRSDARSRVHDHFDRDREAVVEAVRETLRATREEPDPIALEERVDEELIEELRLPDHLPGGWLVPLLRPGVIPALVATSFAAVAGLLAVVLL